MHDLRGADSTPTGTDASGLAGWFNYGVMGLLIIGLITGVFYTKNHITEVRAERDRMIDERNRADDQRDAMAETFQTQLLPVLTKFLTTTEALLPLLQRMVERSGGDQK